MEKNGGGKTKHEIGWQIKSENYNFLFDNWTKQGALYFTEDVRGRWKILKLKVASELGNGIKKNY